MTLREHVFYALSNALENGNFAPGGQLHAASAAAIVDDLLDCDADVHTASGGDPAVVVPHVIAWRTARFVDFEG